MTLTAIRKLSTLLVEPEVRDQVRTTIGDRAIDDLAQLTGGSPSAVTWQLAGFGAHLH